MAGSYTQNIKIKAVLDTTQLDNVLNKLRKTYTLKVKVDTSDVNRLSRSLSSINSQISKIDKNGVRSFRREVQGTTRNTNGLRKEVKGISNYNSGMLSNGFRGITRESENASKSTRELNKTLKETSRINVSGGSRKPRQTISGYYGKSTQRAGAGFSQMGEKYGNFTDNLMSMGSIMGLSALKTTLIDTPARAETNKVLMRTMGDSNVSSDQLYSNLDQITNKLPISMQSVVQPLSAFKAATGASAQQMNDIMPDFVNFGAYVQNMTGSTELAETAMQKLSYGIQGSYAALDQFGITEESLKATGKWKGDENDVKGFMAAVTQIVGDAGESMDTFDGQVANVQKQFSVAGKSIWDAGLGGILKNAASGFVNFNKECGGVPAELGLVAASLGYMGVTAIETSGYFLQTVGSLSQGIHSIQRMRENGGIFKSLKEQLKGAVYGSSGSDKLYMEPPDLNTSGSGKRAPGASSKNGKINTSLSHIEKNTSNTATNLQTLAANNALPWLSTEDAAKVENGGGKREDFGRRERLNRKLTQYSDAHNKRNANTFLNQFSDLAEGIANPDWDRYLETGWLNTKGQPGTQGKYDKEGKKEVEKARNMGSRGRIRASFKQGGMKGGLSYMGKSAGNSFKALGGAITGVIGSFGSLGIAIAGVIAVIAGVSMWLGYASQHSQKVSDAMGRLKESLGKLGSTIGNRLGDLFQSLGWTDKGGMEGLYDVTATILDKVADAVDILSQILGAMPGGEERSRATEIKQANEKLRNPNSNEQTKENARQRLKYFKKGGKWEANEIGLPNETDETAVARGYQAKTSWLGQTFKLLGGNDAANMYAQAAAYNNPRGKKFDINDDTTYGNQYDEIKTNQAINQLSLDLKNAGKTVNDGLKPIVDGVNQALGGLKDALKPVTDALGKLKSILDLKIPGFQDNDKDHTPDTPKTNTPPQNNTTPTPPKGGVTSGGTTPGANPNSTNPLADNQALWDQIKLQSATNAQQNSSNISTYTRNGVANVPYTINGQVPAAMAAGQGLGAGATAGVSNGTAGMGGAAGTKAAQVPGQISSKNGSARGAGHQLGSSGTNGFQSGLSGFGSAISSVVNGALQTAKSYVHQFFEVGAQLGAALSRGAKSKGGDAPGSPGKFQRYFMGALSDTMAFLLNNVPTFEKNSAKLGKSFGIGAIKGENNSFFTLYDNSLKDTYHLLSSANSKYGTYSSPFGADFTAQITPQLNANSVVPSNISSNNKGESPSGGNNIVNNFNIEKVDSKERVKEIGETVVKMLSWNNETAGRIIPDPFPNQ
ncbi:hypothetical protein [Methanosphaera sp.]|jgi:hypothetical protein|uniref:hypothetical protein n=1 Tax=Methanosphaera sp. TaxID=2666342 RepID=UPI003D9467AE